MPVKTYAYTLVRDVRQLVVPPSVEPQEVCIHNHEHGLNREIYLGGQDVTADNGMHAVATQTSIITLQPSDSLWAITPEPTAELRIMVVTKH